MKNHSITTKTIAILLTGSILFTSCASTTIINSNPNGAKLTLNGEPVGVTPYSYTDTKIVGSSNTVLLEQDGYAPLTTSFQRNEEVEVGAIIGGLFVLFPFLWTMKYKPTRTFALSPASGDAMNPVTTTTQNGTMISKADQLRELKKLLDDKILTPAEYEKEKKKILEGGN